MAYEPVWAIGERIGNIGLRRCARRRSVDGRRCARPPRSLPVGLGEPGQLQELIARPHIDGLHRPLGVDADGYLDILARSSARLSNR